MKVSLAQENDGVKENNFLRMEKYNMREIGKMESITGRVSYMIIKAI